MFGIGSIFFNLWAYRVFTRLLFIWIKRFSCMNYLTYYKRLEYLLELIEKGKLSSPHDLTERFECTERTIRKMICDLRNDGHQIKYSRKCFKYFIEEL